eukprot:s689_g17.t1
MLAGATIAVNAAVTTRKAVSFLKEVANIEDEGYFLWKLVDSVSGPLEVAVQLATRYEACEVLEPSIALTRFTLRQVELVLERDDDEQGRPDDKAGWTAWFLSKTDGLTRKQRILDLQPKLSIALQALHTGLTTINNRAPGLKSISPQNSPFVYLEAAADDAYRLLQEFEFGRLDGRIIAAGRLHFTGDQQMWQELGPCEVHLELRNGFALSLRPVVPSDWDPIKLPILRGDFQLQRTVKGQVPGMDCAPRDANVLSYLVSANTLKKYLLEFESVGRLAAETFEALLVMVEISNGGESLLAQCVVPVISNISSGITGVLRGAGSRTTIYFNFTVVQSASELQIDALESEPIGFEFQDSYAYANISQRANSTMRRSVPQILLATWDAFRLVILADAFDNIHLTITDVKISEVPGASRWRLSTWELPEDDKEGTPYIRDEAYVQGFLVPGQLQVFNAFGQTGRENAAILGRESDLFFDMTSSAPIPAGSDLLVEAAGAGPAGFKLFSETAELWTLNSAGAPETKLGEWYCTGMRNLFDPENETAMNLTKEMYLPHPSACEWDETRREMLNSFDYSDPTAERIAQVVVLKITTGAPVDSPLRLKFKVQTPTDRTTFLQERWHIDVELVNRTNGMVNLVTTNDGDPVPLSVVTQLPTEPPPEPSHVAPLTRVEVVIQLDPLDTGAEAFSLTAPPGYSFVHPCRVPFQENKTNNVDEMRCFPLPPLNGRSRARVDCEADRSETNAKGLGTECFRDAPAVIYISTPEASIPPAENVWFVEAVDVEGNNFSSIGDRLGRGTLAGFDIENMDVQVIYGSLASVPVDIGVVFTSRVDVPAQGKVMIKGPPDLQQFGCENKRGTVKPGSLGAITRCQTSVNPPRVTLTLNDTLKAGLHLVIVPGETPRQNPQESLNTFDVFLQMPDDRNLDVSLKVPGEPVQQGLRASVLSFWWTQLLQYDTAFYVTVPIEILDDVDIPLWGILIDFPKEPDFQLDSNDIQVPNKQMAQWIHDLTFCCGLLGGRKDVFCSKALSLCMRMRPQHS